MRRPPIALLTMIPLLLAVVAVRLSPATAPVGASTPTPSPSAYPSSGSVDPAAAGIAVLNIEWTTQQTPEGPVAGILAVVRIEDGAAPIGISPETSEIVLYDAANAEIARGSLSVAIPRRIDAGIPAGMAGTIPLPAGAIVARIELRQIGLAPLVTFAPAPSSTGAISAEADGALSLPVTISAPAGAANNATIEGYTLLRDATGAPRLLLLVPRTTIGGSSRTIPLSGRSPGLSAADAGIESAYAITMP